MASAGQSQTFMRSSYDSHNSFHNTNGYLQKAQSTSGLNRLFSNESALLSPSEKSETEVNFGSRSMSTTWNPPGREQVSSASHVPASSGLSTAEPTPSDEGFWYALYNSATEVHEKERGLWKKERARLMHELQSVKEELARVSRTASGFSLDNGASSVGGKENDKIFYNPQTVRDATEKLRQYSVVSPMGEASNSGRTSRQGSDNVSQQDTPGVMRRTRSLGPGKLSSISEHRSNYDSSAKRVSISDILAGDEARMSPNRHLVIDAEEPPSPPQTTAILSPPPVNFIMHAGHTPIMPRARSKRESFDGHDGSATHLTRMSRNIMLGMTDEDPELASPKFLPSEPKGDVPSLSALDQRLQNLAEHPEETTPEVVKSADAYLANESQHDGEQAPADFQGGIRLKTSRSINFGAELGSLR